MANVYLTTTGNNFLMPNSEDDHLRLRYSADYCKHGGHQLVQTPEIANIILFVGSVDSDLWDVRRHPLVKRYPERCFLYHSEDHIFPFLPGIYPSIKPRDLFGNRAKSGGYSSVLHVDLPFMPFDENCSYLFSFCGSFLTPPFRMNMGMFFDYPRAKIVDTSKEERPLQGYHSPGLHRDRYAQIMRDSKFILCPRGRGLSSWRLFESLKAGRVPVIIADNWVPPSIDIPWEKFSIRVRENDIAKIPDMLESSEAKSPEMALIARQVWSHWFSREMFFSRIIDWCLQIQKERTVSEKMANILKSLHLLHPFNLRHFVFPRIKRQALLIKRYCLPRT